VAPVVCDRSQLNAHSVSAGELSCRVGCAHSIDKLVLVDHHAPLCCQTGAPLTDRFRYVRLCTSCVGRHPSTVSYVMEYMGQQAQDRPPMEQGPSKKGKAGDQLRKDRGPSPIPFSQFGPPLAAS
jgi:hypothetical protein